jgi:glycosyltransferase involved in cell wall biosynthesis
MRICFYAPFKPLDHPNPSGDLIIATGLHDFLIAQGHDVLIASTLRSRWIYWKPWLFPKILKEWLSTAKRVRQFAPDIWLTYHCYYKAPDLLGPSLCQKYNIPYIVFQGIYSTKRRRRLSTAPGFFLNRHALLQATHLFTNRDNDLKNLKRIIPEKKLSYIKPGIFPEEFCFSQSNRQMKHQEWNVADSPVILSAAMFRPDVKTEGLLWMINALEKLGHQDIAFSLVIAGDGQERGKLESFAAKRLHNRVRFVGKVARESMYQFYSGGDIFAFPGIRESLGMVFLEAQSCGLPVIAFNNGGIPEVVEAGKTALLTKPYDEDAFCSAIKQLLQDKAQRDRMGKAAAEHVRTNHDLKKNYLQVEQILINNVRTS